MTEATPQIECAGCAALRKQLDLLQKQVAVLEARLGKNSSNSHKPPSTDDPKAAAERKKRSRNKSKRDRKKGKRGGSQRELLPPDQVTDTHELLPTTCKGCSADLSGVEPLDGPPVLHQQLKLPPITPEVHQYELGCVRCPCCDTLNRAQLPDEARPMLGVRLQALIALLVGVYQMSRRKCQDMMSTLLGVDICLGSVVNANKDTLCAITQPVCEVGEALKDGHAHPQAHPHLAATSLLRLPHTRHRREKARPRAPFAPSSDHLISFDVVTRCIEGS